MYLRVLLCFLHVCVCVLLCFLHVFVCVVIIFLVMFHTDMITGSSAELLCRKSISELADVKVSLTPCCVCVFVLD